MTAGEKPHGEHCPCDTCGYIRRQLHLLSRENRAAVVKLARQQGFKPMEIARLTGLARGTIKRITTR